MSMIMAFITERNAICQVVPQGGVDSGGLQVMGIEHLVRSPAVLAGIVVSVKDGFPPCDVSFVIAPSRRMLPIVRARRVELCGYHCSSALMRTKDKTALDT